MGFPFPKCQEACREDESYAKKTSLVLQRQERPASRSSLSDPRKQYTSGPNLAVMRGESRPRISCFRRDRLPAVSTLFIISCYPSSKGRRSLSWKNSSGGKWST